MSVPKSQDARKPKSAQFPPKPDSASCTVLTGKGRGAVAVILLYGNQSREMLARCFQSATTSRLESGQIRYGLWGGNETDTLAAESVVVTPLSQDSFEIHCHGGSAAIERILSDLGRVGCDIVESDSGYPVSDLLIAEATEVLSRCTTARTAAIAMDQQRGCMLDWVQGALNHFGSDHWGSNVKEQASNMLDLAPIGRVLNEPYRVVLCGSPNVGKSSLLNRLVGYDRSIIFDVAGTTRDLLTASTVFDGWPVVLTDTAGIRSEAGRIEREGIDQAVLAANQADCLLIVHEPAVRQQDDLHERLTAMLNDQPSQSVVNVLNKSDQCEKHDLSMSTSYDYVVSALYGDGIDALISGVIAPLNELQPPSGAAVPVTSRQCQLLNEIKAAKQDAVRRQLLFRMMNETD
ncbi:MAG: GTPase [Rubripirellula sp.]